MSTQYHRPEENWAFDLIPPAKPMGSLSSAAICSAGADRRRGADHAGAADHKGQ